MVSMINDLISALMNGDTATASAIGIDFLQMIIMFIIGGILIYLAIKKDYEPALLLPIGFGAIICNIPFTSIVTHPETGELGVFGFFTKQPLQMSCFQYLFL